MKTLLVYAKLAGLLVCLLISAISPSSAGTTQWLQIGPQVASLNALAIDPSNPSIIYTARDFSIYKSIDGGSSWSRLSEVPDSSTDYPCYVTYLAIQPLDSAIYASTCKAIYKSTDGGISWVAADSGISSFGISKMVPHPTDASVLYFINGGGLYRTTNGADLFYISTEASNIIVDPVTPSTLFIAGARGVYKSTDSGDTWNLSNTGLPGTGVNDIQISGGVAYVATAGYGIYKSVNGGSSWLLANESLNVSKFVIGAGNSTTIYAASTGDGGIYRSIDGGATWLAACQVNCPAIFSVNPQNPSSLFAATSMGLAKSTDGASTWSYSTPSSGLPLAPARVVGVDASNPDNLYAVGFPDYGRPGPGNYRSSDKGAHWSSMGLFNGNPVPPVSISKNYPGVVYGKSTSSYGDDSVYKSVNYGLDWTKIFTVVPYSSTYDSALDVATAPGVILIAGKHCIHGLCNPIFNKSSDNGATWVDVGNGVPVGDSSAYSLTQLISDPSNPNVFYVGGSFGVYKTINGGGLWGNYSSGLSAGVISSLAMDPANPNVLYAGIGYSSSVPTGGGVYKSTDGAVTWSAANAGLTNLIVTSLAIDPANPSNIYAATDGGGVFRSANGGADWAPFSDGLSDADSLSVNSIVLDPQGQNMFIGTNSGAYSYPLGQGEAVEFYQADIDHYFMTASASEVAYLDSQTGWGWARTGKTFNVWLTRASAPGSASPVCRFYGVFANGATGSHFYTADPGECAYVKGRHDWGWGYEGDAFYAVKPGDGACPSGSAPVYRVYNNGMGGAPNHRYMTSRADVDAMVARGWVYEGATFCGGSGGVGG